MSETAEVEQAINDNLDEVMDATGGVLYGGVLYGGARRPPPRRAAPVSRVSRQVHGPRGPVRITGSKSAVSAAASALGSGVSGGTSIGGRVSKGVRHAVYEVREPSGKIRGARYAPGPRGGTGIGGRASRGVSHAVYEVREPSGKIRGARYAPGPRGGSRLTQPASRARVGRTNAAMGRGGRGTSAGAAHNPYIQFLRNYARQNGMSYGDAMIEVKRRGLWNGA